MAKKWEKREFLNQIDEKLMQERPFYTMQTRFYL